MTVTLYGKTEGPEPIGDDGDTADSDLNSEAGYGDSGGGGVGWQCCTVV